MSSGALVTAASGLDDCVLALDALAVGQVGKLAGDLLAVWLVLPADLPDGDAGAFADLRHALNSSSERLGVEDVLRVLLQRRIDGRAGAEVAGFGRSGPPGQDVDLVQVEQALVRGVATMRRSRSQSDRVIQRGFVDPSGFRAGAMYASRAPGARSQAFRSSRRSGLFLVVTAGDRN